METVLVTGTAGLIGSHVSQWLLDHTDTRVIGVDDFSCGLRSNVPKGLHGFYELTLGDGDLNAVFERERPDRVMHFASFAAECLSPFVRMHSYKNVLMSSIEVINCCLNYEVKRLLHTSSMSVYGAGKAPFEEDAPTAPIDSYAVAKAAVERDIWVAQQQHGLDACVVRPHNCYGEGQVFNQRFRNVIALWMNRFKLGLPIRVFGDGSQVRAFSYIADAVPCFWRAATESQCRGETINLGGVVPTTILEAAQTLQKILPGSTIVHEEPRHEVHEAWSSWQKSVDLLGFEHKTPLKEGMRRMWDWVKRQPILEELDIPIEVSRGLYSYWQPEAKIKAS